MTAKEVIAEAQLLSGDPNIDFHDRARMLLALNRATNRISTRSRSIHESLYHSVVAGQYEYALPEGTLHIRKAKYRQGTWYDLRRGYFNDVEARAAYPGGGPPSHFSLWQNARSEKFVGVVSAIDFDESRALSFQRSVTFPLTYREPAHRGAVKIGDIVFNLSTRHAEGTITGVNAADEGRATQVFYTTLTGGDAGVFSLDNQIRVTSPHTQGHSLILAPSPVRTDESGEESIAVFVARRHRVITTVEMDTENDVLELDEEFNDTLMYEILHWSRVQRMGLDATATHYRAMSNSEYLMAIPMVENRIFMNLNAWEQGVLDGSIYRDVLVKASGGGYNAVTVA